jgi:hypothetical protein
VSNNQLASNITRRTRTDQNKRYENPESYPQRRASDVPESPREEPLDEYNGKKPGDGFGESDHTVYMFKYIVDQR